MAVDKKTKEELREQRKAQEAERMKAEKRSGMVKMLAVGGGIALLLILGVYAMVKTSGNTQSQDQSQPIASVKSPVPPITTADNVEGSPSAKLTLIEYGDFQCPACGNYYPVVKQLRDTYLPTGKVRFVFRNFPLTNLHPNAMHAAEAAYAAGKQGKFFEMHDLLYGNQAKWSDLKPADADQTFLGYAKQLQLDTAQFTQDMGSNEAAAFIKNQENKGIELGVNSTPTFYLNNHLLQNPSGYDAFKALIDQQLAK